MFRRILLIWLACHISYIKAVRPYQVHLTHSNCSASHPAYTAYFECPIFEMPKNRGNYINAKLMFKRDIHQININFRVSIQRPVLGELELINFVVDGCRLFEFNPRGNVILKAVVEKMLQSSNVPRNCPLKANFVYTANRFSLNPDYFPPYTPNVNFTVKLLIMVQESTLIASAIINGAIVQKSSSGRKTKQ